MYRNTTWEQDFSGYGVQIQQVGSRRERRAPESSSPSVSWQIIIEKSPTAVAPGNRHFNMRGSPVANREVWDVKKLLEVTEGLPGWAWA